MIKTPLVESLVSIHKGQILSTSDFISSKYIKTSIRDYNSLSRVISFSVHKGLDNGPPAHTHQPKEGVDPT